MPHRESVEEPVRKTVEGRLNIIAQGDQQGAGQGSTTESNTQQELESAMAVNQEELDTLGRENAELKGVCRSWKIRSVHWRSWWCCAVTSWRRLRLSTSNNLHSVKRQTTPVLPDSDSMDITESEMVADPDSQVDYNFQSDSTSQPSTQPDNRPP